MRVILTLGGLIDNVGGHYQIRVNAPRTVEST